MLQQEKQGAQERTPRGKLSAESYGHLAPKVMEKKTRNGHNVLKYVETEEGTHTRHKHTMGLTPGCTCSQFQKTNHRPDTLQPSPSSCDIITSVVEHFGVLSQTQTSLRLVQLL